jgi:hypothetical protein
VHFGAGRLGFGLVLPALENAESPYVILNRPSAVWQPVIDREKETQQHVGVKVRARSIPRVSLTVGCFSNAARASAPRGIGAIQARFAPKPREPDRVRDDPAPCGGTGASARAIEDAGGVPSDLPSPSSPFSALRRHETTPGWVLLGKIAIDSESRFYGNASWHVPRALFFSNAVARGTASTRRRERL